MQPPIWSESEPKPPFIRLSSCKRRPDNSCRCTGVEPTPTDISPYDIPRPGPTRASAPGAQFPRKELSCRLGHDVAAADIDAGGREGAVRLLGGCGGRDGGTGFQLVPVGDLQTLNRHVRADDELFL